ncbi:MAG TPA: helix-turn-helix transcriptional regulator [Candidatus Kryptonia bacterium]|nr:helix-turn-helix transcriptional regulator [Candidatus Kryptonia bacterium]
MTTDSWPFVAAELSTAMGGAAVLFTLRRPTPDDATAVIGTGIAAEFVDVYREQVGLNERWLPWAIEVPPGAVISVSDFLTERQFIRTAFFADWMRPQRLLPAPVVVAVVLTQAGRPVATVAIFRPWGSGPVGDPEVALLRRLMPHLQRAVAIHDELSARRSTGGEPAAPALQARYGLTVTEAGVAVQLAQGRSLAEIAGTLGICINTARVHLQHIFAKTGTRRQAALVHRLLSAGTLSS